MAHAAPRASDSPARDGNFSDYGSDIDVDDQELIDILRLLDSPPQPTNFADQIREENGADTPVRDVLVKPAAGATATPAAPGAEQVPLQHPNDTATASGGMCVLYVWHVLGTLTDGKAFRDCK